LKSFLAYTFIANEFDKGRDPLAILAAIIERSLLKGLFVKDFHLSDLRSRILEDWGLSVPISILETQVFSLRKSGIVEILTDSKSGRKNYSLTANSAAVELVDAGESAAKEKYARIVNKIDDARIALGIAGNGEEILSTWLDANPDGVARIWSISNSNRDLKIASSVIAKAMGLDANKNTAFIDDITDLVVGDQLYSAILETTQLQSDILASDEGSSAKKKMADVNIFLDVGILARLRGHFGQEMKLASTEFLDMAHALGAKIKTFDHTIDELKTVMEAALNQMKYYPSEAYGPIPAYMLEESKTPTEISEEIDATEADVQSLGVEIVSSPPIQEGLGLDEIEFDRILQQDVGMDNPVARRKDIASLRSIYMIRNGEPHIFLERSKAIFVTQNWALQAASHRFFKPYFDGKTPSNSVQICFTEAVIASRLWTRVRTHKFA